MREMGGMTGLLLLLWVGTTVNTAANLHKRVIGGNPCTRHFHVKITDYDDDFMCGGSLISANWILTAAHCWGLGMKAILDSQSSQPDIMQITASPKIYEDNNKKIHDIMLLQLPRPAKIPQDRIVKLPDCNNIKQPPIKSKVQVAGYGDTSPGPEGTVGLRPSNTLHCADIDVIHCQGLINHIRNKFVNLYQVFKDQHWFCAKTDGVDISPGDSGGGVVYKESLYGVISFSGNKTHALLEPAGFMDVCAYRNWIKTTTGI